MSHLMVPNKRRTGARRGSPSESTASLPNSSRSHATFVTEIPISQLRSPPPSLELEVKAICDKTRTHIFGSEDARNGKVKYSVWGKWRDCIAATRLLWYKLTKEFTFYINGSWLSDIEKPTTDGKSLKSLYPVTIGHSDNFNCITVRGPFWNVFKFGKELVKRTRPDCASGPVCGDNVPGYLNKYKTTEAAASAILQTLKVDVRGASPRAGSPFFMTNNELLLLLIGPKVNGSLSTRDKSPSLPRALPVINRALPFEMISPSQSPNKNQIRKAKAHINKLEDIDFVPKFEQPKQIAKQSNDVTRSLMLPGRCPDKEMMHETEHAPLNVADESGCPKAAIKEHGYALLKLLEKTSYPNLDFELKMVLRKIHVETDLDSMLACRGTN